MRKSLLIAYMESESTEHNRTLSALRGILEDYTDVLSVFKKREETTADDTAEADLIITVGGDGTLLGIAHKITGKIPVLGINSDVGKKVGFFTRATRNDIEEKMKRFAAGDYSLIPLMRIIGKVGDNALPPALNEVFFGNLLPYRTSRYQLKAGKHDVKQISSGVLVSTAAGSNGWAGAAGGNKLELDRKGIQVVVREPTAGTICDSSVRNIPLETNDTVSITSYDDHNIAVADSISDQIHVQKGETLTVTDACDPLHLVEFR